MGINALYSQSNEDCMMCHEDQELTMVKGGKTISVFVKASIIGKSVHKDVDCTSCHEDANVEEFPHPERLKVVELIGLN
ncbi:MAG: hypothetical protein CVU00_15155 [Bacteroidetes bacterium HGW-Bacteroidetes-17]|nr:MAG: hypothetical protein CVU00_15155 [Bacteroidetes bacterium HGW-Bacteroidetes-17]